MTPTVRDLLEANPSGITRAALLAWAHLRIDPTMTSRALETALVELGPDLVDADGYLTLRASTSGLRAVVSAGPSAIEVSGPGRSSVVAIAELWVGDCFDQLTEDADRVLERESDEPHDAEVFVVLRHPASMSEPFPDETTIESWLDIRCEPAFQAYTGADWADQEALDYFYLTPSIGSWDQGERRIVCYLARVDGAKLSRSFWSAFD